MFSVNPFDLWRASLEAARTVAESQLVIGLRKARLTEARCDVRQTLVDAPGWRVISARSAWPISGQNRGPSAGA